MEEAIRGYTAYGAYFTWEEDTKGTLAPGMLADMIVLSEDLLTIDLEKILDVQVEMTVVDGKVLFERNQLARKARVRFRCPSSVTTTLSSTRTPPKGASSSMRLQLKWLDASPSRNGRSNISMK